MKRFLAILILFLGYNLAIGQVKVRDQDVIFRKHLVRSINLKNSSNSDIFGENALLSTILLDAVASDKLMAFTDRDFKKCIDKEEILSKVIISGDDTTGGFYSHSICDVELGEDIIFDKHRSDFSFEHLYIALMIPEMENYRGILEPLAYFKFEDCIKIFNTDDRAYSLNFSGTRVPFEDLFLSHAYKSEIIKIGNGNYFDQIYSNRTDAFIAAKHEENELRDFLFKFFNPY